MAIPRYLSEIIAYRKQRSHRIEALADGVFAIAMTLLVLDIRIPLKGMETEKGVWLSLLHTLPEILTFILSFSVAGQFWSIFINHFNYIHTSDRNENIIALFYLMIVSFLPFSTSFLSDHLWSRVAVGFYIFNIVLILTFNTLHWYYAYYNGLVNREGNIGMVIHQAIMIRAKTAFAAYIIAIGCCFINSYLALCVTILVHVIFTFSGFIEILHAPWRKKIKVSSELLLLSAPELLVETVAVEED